MQVTAEEALKLAKAAAVVKLGGDAASEVVEVMCNVLEDPDVALPFMPRLEPLVKAAVEEMFNPEVRHMADRAGQHCTSPLRVPSRGGTCRAAARALPMCPCYPQRARRPVGLSIGRGWDLARAVHGVCADVRWPELAAPRPLGPEP